MGTCFLPSYTAMVWPTISGKIVEARDHVLITRFSPDSFICRIFFKRLGWAYGPFFEERPIVRPPLRYCLRRRTIRASDFLPFLRVLTPKVGLPQGVTGLGMPIGEWPSPPPCG